MLSAVTFVICISVANVLLLSIMAIKLICPVCTSDWLQGILRDVQFSARLEGHSYELSDLVAFSCAKGHVFFVMSHNAEIVDGELKEVLVM